MVGDLIKSEDALRSIVGETPNLAARLQGIAERAAKRNHMMWNEDGAQGRNRTTDTVIFSHVLYQLSYLGAGATANDRPKGGGYRE